MSQKPVTVSTIVFHFMKPTAAYAERQVILLAILNELDNVFYSI